MNDRLYRSRDDRMFAGVAGGIAQRFELDPSLVRVLWVILMFVSGGIFFLLYVVMAIVVPEAPIGEDRWASWSAGPPGAPPTPPAPGAVPGWTPPTGAGEPFVSSAAFAAGTPSAEGGAVEGGESATAAGPGADESASGAADTGADASAAPSGPPAGSLPPPAASQWTAPPSGRHREHGTSGAIIFGVLLVLLGAFFLVRSVAPQIDLGPFWPVILIVIGVAFLIGSLRPSGGGSPG